MKRNNKGQFAPGTHWRTPKPWWNKEWLQERYITRGESAEDIAKAGGVTANAILFWLKKHRIQTRSTAEVRARKHWGAYGSDNPMWNKRGELNPRWLGGVTPDRQAFYASDEWKHACSMVWKRDNATCQRCGAHHDSNKDLPMHIHHIESFAVVSKRSELSNLVLLCEVCHWFVHSKRNTEREYLPSIPNTPSSPAIGSARLRSRQRTGATG